MPTLQPGFLVAWLEAFVSFLHANVPEIDRDFSPRSALVDNLALHDDERSLLIGRIMMKLGSFPGITELVERISSDERMRELLQRFAKHWKINAVGIGGAYQISPISYAMQLMREYIYYAKDSTFDLHLAKTIEDNLIWSLDTGKTKNRYQAILPYLESPYFEINGEFIIKPGLDMNHLHFKWGMPHPNPEYSIVEFIENTDLVTSCSSSPNYEITLKTIEEIVIALKLLKSERFFWEGTRISKAEPGFICGSLGMYIPKQAVSPFARAGCSLSDEDCAQLDSVIAYVTSAFENQQYRLALQRFFIANTKDHFEDAIIDYCIAAEAIFGDEEPNDVSKRLIRRFSAALESLPSARGKIESIIEQAYRIRSKIVHGFLGWTINVEKRNRSLEWANGELECQLRKYFLKCATKKLFAFPSGTDFDIA